MRSDWVAASVRARSMAQRRAGAGTCRFVAAAPNLQAGLERLSDSSYSNELRAARTLPEADVATRRTVLWQLRVMAGWLPAGGARLVRAAAAAFEADNIVALDVRLRRGQAVPGAGAPAGGRHDGDTTPVTMPGGDRNAAAGNRDQQFFDLGGLATAWPRLRTAGSEQELRLILSASPWGDPGTESALADVLTVVWLRRLAAEAAEVRPWAASAGALLCARLVLVNGTSPDQRLLTLLRPLTGTGWTGADTPEALRASLPPAAARVLEPVAEPMDLWRAEAALATRVEADGFHLLRAGLPGPDVVLGAMAVLAVDAWRVRAALAAAAVNAGSSEVLNAVA